MESQQPTPYKILLIGDSCIDEYQYGNVNRLSPEAPVPILDFVDSKFKPGMGDNVMSNLKALGCEVFFKHGHVSRKVRMIDIKTKHHLLRIDHDNITPTSYAPENDLEQYDAIVFSDYDKGFVSYESISSTRKVYSGPIFVDTKKPDLKHFEGCYVKINELEFRNSTSKCSQLITTLGGNGAMYKGGLYPGVKTELVDVCGAGDTFLAALVYFMLEHSNVDVAIEMANKASAITVSHFGTYSPTLEEIYAT